MNGLANRTAALPTIPGRTWPGTLALLTALLGGVGCSAASPGGEPSSGSEVASANPATVDPASVSIQGTAQAPDGSPIAGVAVCVRPDPLVSTNALCTTSTDDGSWRLAGAANSWLAITFIKTNFVPLLRPIGTTTSDVTIAAGDGVLIASSDATLIGGAIAAGSGRIAFSTATPGAPPTASATVVLGEFDGTTISGSPPAPIYTDASDQPVPGATSGTAGVFENLAPGYYAIAFRGVGVACSDSSGLYGFPITAYTPAGEALLVVPVVEGFVTAPVAASCSAVDSGS